MTRTVPDVRRTQVMAILNATPDSFSDGGRLPTGQALVRHIDRLVEEGADVLDIGGESTRPGHAPVDAATETTRVLPVIKAANDVCDLPISIDTRKAAVAKAALTEGATIVNDVSGLQDPAMGQVIAEAGCQAVLMRHTALVGEPVAACRAQLQELLDRAIGAGIPRKDILLDPGLGFGDPPGGDPQPNLLLVDRLAEAVPGPALIGASRKRFVGTITGVEEATQRVHGSVAVACLAALRGAAMVRVHDVAATAQALRVITGLSPAR